MPRGDLFASLTIEPAMVVILKPTAILDEAMIAEMTVGLENFIKHSQGRPFVFDFSRVAYLSSGALGMLLKLRQHFTDSDLEMKLAGMNQEVLEVFRITRLDKTFDIHRDTKEAIAALQKEP